MDKAELVNKLAKSADLAKIAAEKTLKSVLAVIATYFYQRESIGTQFK